MFGERLKELRLAHGLTLRQLGKEINVSYSSLSNYENGTQQPNFETLEKISEFFQVRLDYLTGKSDIANFNDYYFYDDLKNIYSAYKNAPQIMQEKFSLILDNIYLICNEIISSEENTYIIETLQKITNDLLLIQCIAKNDIFINKMTGNDLGVETAYKNYLCKKNDLNYNIDKFFNDIVSLKSLPPTTE